MMRQAGRSLGFDTVDPNSKKKLGRCPARREGKGREGKGGRLYQATCAVAGVSGSLLLVGWAISAPSWGGWLI